MLRRTNMVEVAADTTDLSLTMPKGRSARIKDVRYYMLAAAAEDFDLTIDQRRIMQFKAPSGWFLITDDLEDANISVVSELQRLGLFPVIPVASGQTLTLTAPGSNNLVEVVYDEYDEDDVSASEPNGSESNEYTLFQVISNASAPTQSMDLELDQSDLDTLFPAFPGGAVVPANHSMELLALFGAGASHGTGSANGQYTDRLKFLKEQEALFDRDLSGFLYRGDIGYTTDATQYKSEAGRLSLGVANERPRIITFEHPILFTAGEELNVFCKIVETTAANDFAAADIKLGLVFRVRRM